MRNALVAAGLLVLLALVAVGSRGAGDRPAEVGGGAPAQLTDALYTLAIVAVIGGVLAYFLLRLGAAKVGGARSARSSLIQLLVVWGVLIAIALLFYRTYEGVNPFAAFAEAFERGIRGPGYDPGEIEAPAAARRPEFQWWLAALMVVAISALAVFALRRVQPPRAPTAADEVEALLDDVLDELEFDEDPRRAVIQAYARMERVLAAHGFGRLPHEAPLEYLARVLRELNVRAESAHALTELFERATFSLHEIDAAMKSEAISSLAAVRDDLRAAA